LSSGAAIRLHFLPDDAIVGEMAVDKRILILCCLMVCGGLAATNVTANIIEERGNKLTTNPHVQVTPQVQVLVDNGRIR